MDQRVQHAVGRRGHAQGLPAPDQEAVQVIDLGRLAARQVLRGRGELARHRLRDLAHRLTDVAQQGDAVGRGHRQALVDELVHHRPDALPLHQLAVRLLRQGGQRVVGAVDQQLGPQRAAHVVRDVDRHAGRHQRLRGALGAGRGLDDQLAAAVVLHMAGPGHLRRDVHHRRGHRLRHGLAQPLGVVDAVLHRQQQRVRAEVRRQRLRRRHRVGRLHAEQHQLRAAGRGGLGVGAQADLFVEHPRLHAQAVIADRRHVGRPPDQRHVMAGARQHAAEEAAHRAGAHHGDLQRQLRRCLQRRLRLGNIDWRHGIVLVIAWGSRAPRRAIPIQAQTIQPSSGSMPAGWP